MVQFGIATQSDNALTFTSAVSDVSSLFNQVIETDDGLLISSVAVIVDGEVFMVPPDISVIYVLPDDSTYTVAPDTETITVH